MSELRASQLPTGVKELLWLLQNIGYGSIENLVVVQGIPVLALKPRITRETMFKSDTRPGNLLPKGDFVLKAQMVQLVRQLESMDTGVIQRLEIKGGLPFRLIAEDLHE